jgi:polar amino acid transport system permease protein
MEVLALLSSGIGQTLGITFGALVLGSVLAVPLAALRRSELPAASTAAKILIEGIRGVPPIVWLLLIYFALGETDLKLTTFQASVLGLGIVSTAYIAEIYRSGLDAIPGGQFEAADALGMPFGAKFFKVITPQAATVVIPPLATFAIGLLKDSALASVIGAQDITFRAFQEAQANLNGLTVFMWAALLYILLSIPIAALARYTGYRLTRKVAA